MAHTESFIVLYSGGFTSLVAPLSLVVNSHVGVSLTFFVGPLQWALWACHLCICLTLSIIILWANGPIDGFIGHLL